MESFNFFEDLNLSLEDKGWFCKDLNLDQNELNLFIEKSLENQKQGLFLKAKINESINPDIESSIRKSEIFWIDNWQDFPLGKFIEAEFYKTMQSVNRYFFLSMKGFESQFSYYKKGGFYKKHLDQFMVKKNRQLSCVLFLNNCKLGGELVIYNKENIERIDIKITPKAGRIVFFFSGQIYHEVLETIWERYSLTSWFNDKSALF